MKNIKIAAVSTVVLVGLVFIISSFTNKEQKAQGNMQYAQITALESHAKGGTGRSRLVVTYSDGRQEESELENYQSFTGINFGNVTGNEKKISAALNKVASQGYEFKWLESGVSEGIYVTKYLLVKNN
jgi:hypothetical protein